MGTKLHIWDKLKIKDRIYVFGELVNKNDRFNLEEGATLGGVPIEPYLDIPRKLAENGQVRLDVFVFQLSDPKDESSIGLNTIVELHNNQYKKELWHKVDKILWEEWDPIGVRDYGGPDDEYRGYVSPVVELLEEGADISKIAKQLHQLANEHMGLSSSIQDHQKAARKLKDLTK